MIKMIRIDERLIHGQVAVIWSKYLGIDHILVINDHAAEDPIMKSTLKLAAPDNVKVLIVNHAKGEALLTDPRINQLNMLIVVNSPKDAAFATTHNAAIKKVNVGNYGRANATDESVGTKEKINDNVYLDDEDKRILKDLLVKGLTVEYQLVPDTPVTNLKDKL